MRLIDADAFEFEATSGVMNGVLFMGRSTGRTLQLVRSCLEAMINNVPTIDAVEVVRCKDCKRCYEHRTKRNKQLMRFCMRMDGNEFQVNANDFCSYGERKDNE